MGFLFRLPSGTIGAFIQHRPNLRITVLVPGTKREVVINGRESGTRQTVTTTVPPLLITQTFGESEWWKLSVDRFRETLRYFIFEATTVGETIQGRPYRLGNVASDASVCWGRGNPIPYDIREAMNAFWGASFNADLTEDLLNRADPDVAIATYMMGTLRGWNAQLALPTQQNTATFFGQFFSDLLKILQSKQVNWHQVHSLVMHNVFVSQLFKLVKAIRMIPRIDTELENHIAIGGRLQCLYDLEKTNPQLYGFICGTVRVWPAVLESLSAINTSPEMLEANQYIGDYNRASQEITATTAALRTFEKCACPICMRQQAALGVKLAKASGVKAKFQDSNVRALVDFTYYINAMFSAATGRLETPRAGYDVAMISHVANYVGTGPSADLTQLIQGKAFLALPVQVDAVYVSFNSEDINQVPESLRRSVGTIPAVVAPCRRMPNMTYVADFGGAAFKVGSGGTLRPLKDEEISKMLEAAAPVEAAQ